MSDPHHAVLIARFNLRSEAEVARGFLEQAEVSSVLQVDDGGGAFGAPLSFSLDSFAGLLVLEEDATRARRLLLEAGYTVLGDDGREIEPEGDAAPPRQG